MLEDGCPYFMAIGMTYDQYWHGDALMKRSFFKAHKILQKKLDEQMWLQGLYTYNALLATVGNLFLEEGHEPNRYPTEPFMEERDKEEAERLAEEKRAKEEERERLRLVAYLNQVMATRKQQER